MRTPALNFVLVALLLSACGSGDMMSMLPGGGGWRKIAMPSGQDDANVTGVFCTAAGKCVVTTHSNTGDPGAVFALSDTAVGEKLVDGVYPGTVPSAASVLGDLDFDGLEKTPTGVMARLSASGAYISATGDITQKSSWTVVPMGRADGDTLPLNAQAAIRLDSAGKALFINKRGFVYSSSGAPADSTTWTKLWSPQAVPSVPADFAAQLALDSRLCDSDVTAGGLPMVSNPAYISADQSLIVTVAGGLNQDGNAPPGVCISTDKGVHFYSVPFAGTPMSATNPGPIGVTCLDNDKCFAFNGLPFQEGTAYVYFTTNASMGKNSTWTRATLPAAFSASSDITLSGMFFAPDGTHGWLVGNNSHKASGVLDNDLYNGFALDADHVWLTGRFGTLMATSTAQK
jgi:hypothetical protein